MNIHVVRTMQAAPDGRTIETYEAGKTYGMPPELAATFIEQCWGHPEGEPFSDEQMAAAEAGKTFAEWTETERLRVENELLRERIAKLEAAPAQPAREPEGQEAAKGPRRR